MTRFFNYTTPVAAKDATGLVAQIYDQIRQDMGLTPEPFTLHGPVPLLLAGAWAMFRETLLVGKRSRGEKEIVATAVAQANRCPWCVDSHTVVLHATGHHASQDPQHQALVSWAAASGQKNSMTTTPFSADDAVEFMATALNFHYLTRMVTIFLTESPLPSNGLVKGLLQRLGGRFYTRQASQVNEVGRSAELLPAAKLPAELAWMGSGNIATAFAGMAAVLEAEVEEVLAASTRAWLQRHLQRWDGSAMPLSRAWTEPLLAVLPASERPMACLALLAALAPHQVGESVVTAVRQTHKGDRPLIAVAAWGSFQAVLCMGQWLAASGNSLATDVNAPSPPTCSVLVNDTV